MSTHKNAKYWLMSALLSGVLAGLFSLQLFGDDQSLFLPGTTSSGHYQIELACQACHKDAFGGADSIQEACMDCHGEELKHIDDSHPKSKFTDPRNAERVKRLDARACATCHVEHRPEITLPMGLTVPQDVCRQCHYDIEQERPSHKGMSFDTCADAGCHNFHDNKALYEDFLLKHAGEPDHVIDAVLPQRDFVDTAARLSSYPAHEYPLEALHLQDRDVPSGVSAEQKILNDWLETAHARQGVNCSGCHGKGANWVSKPDQDRCRTCHEPEVAGFLGGKHGMRLAQKLEPMVPGLARSAMRSDAHDRELSCTSCHSAHRFDTRLAAVEACLRCHNDEHSLAYKDGPHYQLWLQAGNGALPEGAGVSCASCHLPRIEHKQDGVARTLVQHNQNDTLRPNEKMLRPVCMQCHGLAFGIDALADEKLVKRNFDARPARHVESIEMAQRRMQDEDRGRRTDR